MAGHPADPAAPPALAPVARLGELPPGTLLGVTAPDGTPVCLANVDGVVCALVDRCSHRGFALSAGELLPDGSVQCAWHGARFDARTGSVRGGPAREPVPPVAVTVTDDGLIRLGAPPQRDRAPGT